MEIYGNLLIWKLWKSLEIYGKLWILWKTMEIYGTCPPFCSCFFSPGTPPNLTPCHPPHLAFCAKFYQKKREDPKSEMTKNGKSRRMIDNKVIQYKKNACCASCLPKFTRKSNEFKIFEQQYGVLRSKSSFQSSRKRNKSLSSLVFH